MSAFSTKVVRTTVHGRHVCEVHEQYSNFPSLLTHIGYGGRGLAPVAVEVLFAGVVGEEAGRPRDQLGLVAAPALAALHHRHSQEDALDYAANIFRVFRKTLLRL